VRRRVLVPLNRIDRLTRDAHAVRQLLLSHLARVEALAPRQGFYLTGSLSRRPPGEDRRSFTRVGAGGQGISCSSEIASLRSA